MRTIISESEFEALVKKGVVVRAEDEDEIDSWYKCKYSDHKNNLTALDIGQNMYKDLIRTERYELEVFGSDDNPMDTKFGWFVPEWIFVDRQEDLLRDYEEKEKNA